MHLRDSPDPSLCGAGVLRFWSAPERLACRRLWRNAAEERHGHRPEALCGGIYAAACRVPSAFAIRTSSRCEADPTKAYNQDDATGFIRSTDFAFGEFHGQRAESGKGGALHPFHLSPTLPLTDSRRPGTTIMAVRTATSEMKILPRVRSRAPGFGPPSP